MVTLTPPEEEEWEGLEILWPEEAEGQAKNGEPKNVIFLCFFPLSLSFVFPFTFSFVYFFWPIARTAW